MEKPWKEKPAFPGRKTRHRNIFDERGVSPVIAVILMVAITVVLAAVLYVMVSRILPPPEITPRYSMRFDEDDEVAGKYIGEFQGSVRLDKIEIAVFDESTDDTILLDPDTETYEEAASGINITYKDINENEKLDVVDILIIQGGDTDDRVTIVYLPTGESVATQKLN
jgi:flagellin-like protein